jgi:hypothetical protein
MTGGRGKAMNANEPGSSPGSFGLRGDDRGYFTSSIFLMAP